MIAQSMDIPLLAEGVEHTEQFEFLRNAGCTEVQGFLFSASVSVDEARSRFGLMQSTLDLFDADRDLPDRAVGN